MSEHPILSISFFHKKSQASLKVLGNLAIAGSALSVLLLIPHDVNAFWPFYTTQAAGGSQTVLHDSTLPLLVAAVNVDPQPDLHEDQLVTSNGSALVDTTGVDGQLASSTLVEKAPDTSSQQSTDGSITTYVVKEGDSLSGIASKFNISMNTVLWANDIKDPKLVRPGMSLNILPVTGVRHTVTRGETLSSLAGKYTADSSDIAAYNGINADSPLSVGDDIIIPGGVLPKTVAPTKSLTHSTTSTTNGKTTTITTTKVTSKIKTGGSLSQIQANPYKGGSGAEMDGFFTSPIPGGLITQGIHGWNGIDIGAPNGTPIYAAAGGTVIISKMGGWNGGYGNYVVIDHGNGTQTLYSHLSSDAVSVGQNVSSGERIGGVGISGEATGYHLHFEVRGAKNPFAGCEVMTRCDPS